MLWTLLCLAGVLVGVHCLQNRLVSTSDGVLRGYTFETRNGRQTYAFSGVPFAQPPVGKLRFKDPLPPMKWSGIRNAVDFGQPCQQYLFFFNFLSNITIGNEDCLYLSVYTPGYGRKLPVLVNFHGGGFFTGFGELLRSPSYLLDEDVVVVTGNYRLGALGFLSFEDDVVSGNYGLKDQNMILKWVRNNIGFFGGDPEQVTIIGESAGGASVHYHLISPLSRGYFQRAISMSGTALAPWAYSPPGVARQRSLILAQNLGCPVSNTQEALNCLITKDANEITNARRQFRVWDLEDPLVVFRPCVDAQVENSFLPGDPFRLQTLPVPWIIGNSKNDGFLKTGEFVKYPSAFKTFNKNFNYLFPIIFSYNDSASNPLKVSKKLRKFYFGKKPIDFNVFRQMTDLYTDAAFLYPTMASVRNHTGKIYLYYNEYEGENSFAEFIGSRRVYKEATHTDELIYIWNVNTFFPPLRNRDLTFSRLLVKMIANFMKTDEPTEGFSFDWKTWDVDESFLQISAQGIESRLGHKLLETREKFWSSLKFRDLL